MANDIAIARGTTYSFTHEYLKGGSPSNDGATLLFTVKAAESDLDNTDAAALGGLKYTITMSGYQTAVTIAPADSQSISPGKWWYDIKVKEASGAIYRTFKGRFIIDASPTNRLA